MSMTTDDMSCPNCESEGPFWIACEATVREGKHRVFADYVAWDDTSRCTCDACYHTVPARFFRVGQVQAPEGEPIVL